MPDYGGFEAFVVAAGGRLHATAYLLARDHGLAEDLVQVSLARAWMVWERVHGDPEPYVRKILVRGFISSRRRRWWAERPSEQLPETGSAHPQADIEERGCCSSRPSAGCRRASER